MNTLSMRMAAIALLIILVSCRGLGGTMSAGETKQRLINWLGDEFQLKPIACPEPHEQKHQDGCFLIDVSAEEWAKRIDLLKSRLRPITGWRDNYGVLGGAFEFDNQPYEVGLDFVRVGEGFPWDGTEYDQIRSQDDPGYVAISVTNESPRDR